MRYHNITKEDMLNGDGLRVVLWVAGCTHRCPDCQNPITWDIEGGIPFDQSAMNEITEQMKKDYISGITFSGGDPLHPQNVKFIENLAIYLKNEYPEKTIWLYTGFLWEDVKDFNIIKYIDVLIDGKFIKELKDVKLHWVGSSNQRVIDVQSTLKKNKVILWKS